MIFALGDRSPVFDGDDHFIADNATVIGSVRLGTGSSVWFNAVVRGDNDWIEIGAFSNVQDGAILHADPGTPTFVGEGVTIGHNALVHGCTIGDNSLVGIGSSVLNNARIGSNCLVGAHALVTEGKEFPDGVLILGTPAKVVRKLQAPEIEHLRWSAQVYVDNARRYREQLTRVDSA
jgi:carbonic anhydrase/acetyltransferase-like protein (isoleucine patch superfamily)